MSDTKISDLAAVTDVLATDEYVLARSGATKKIDASNLLVASEVAFTPTGTIASTDVQAAIAEVATEAGGGAASSVSFTPAGTIAATNVQAAIEEVATEAGGGTGLYDAWAYVRHEVSSGTDGGTTTTSTWVTCPINTETSDADGIVSIASNQFTLAAGTYLVHARATGVGNSNATSYHRLRLRNITDSSTIEVGASRMTFNGGGELTVRSRFTLAGSKALSIEHWTNDGRATIGMGIATSASVVEVYTEVEIWREA